MLWRRWQGLLAGLSLQTKFVLLFVLVSLPVLTATSLGAWYFVKERSQYLEEQSLDLASGLLRMHLAAVPTSKSLEAGGADAIGGEWLRQRRLGVLVHELDGRMLLSSLSPELSAGLMAAPQPFTASHSDWKGGDGSTHRVEGLDASLADGRPVRLILLLETGKPNRVQQAYQSVLIAIALAGGLLTVALGLMIVQQGLEPLRNFAARTRDITASSLGDRLGIDDAPAELRELAEGLNDMLQRLQDSFRRLDEFSSDLAHELRTPIGNMLGQSEVALSRARSVEEYRAVLESNIEEFHRLSRMIQDMLFLAQADSTARALTLEPVQLHEQVDKVLEYYEPLLDDKQIRVLRRGTGTASANRLLAQRAIANLLSNAVRHAPPGTMLEVAVDSPEPGRVALTVTNTGKGIPLDELPWIFQRFFRGQAARAGGEKGEGWGLGLAIVKAIMDMHGGRVSVHSTEDGTTAFTLYFPQAVPKGASDH